MEAVEADNKTDNAVGAQVKAVNIAVAADIN
jgi:hypothetical protein